MGDATVFYVEHTIAISIIDAANEVLACPIESMFDPLITNYLSWRVTRSWDVSLMLSITYSSPDFRTWVP